MQKYAKVIVNGSPITKSNFKLHNKNGRAILPDSSGKYHDRYALYEQEIALIARSQNPDIVFSESLIAILKVYYKINYFSYLIKKIKRLIFVNTINSLFVVFKVKSIFF